MCVLWIVMLLGSSEFISLLSSLSRLFKAKDGMCISIGAKHSRANSFPQPHFRIANEKEGVSKKSW